ncbi:hypothetical protein [Rubinisphaera margarita]|uniref:hypothetical protein n=1 Tax=Rubinisphaera margarita TaxID=2909586 RepID=UPI001EE89DA1|nr:hypothetical protein [Rubinisphaera margarita]MCG6155771.1 hypothetical protein [Rubinisphaera margarita]
MRHETDKVERLLLSCEDVRYTKLSMSRDRYLEITSLKSEMFRQRTGVTLNGVHELLEQLRHSCSETVVIYTFLNDEIGVDIVTSDRTIFGAFFSQRRVVNGMSTEVGQSFHLDRKSTEEI